METLGKRKRKQVQWPCVLCDKECKVTGSATNRLRLIECSQCSGCVHEKCSGMTRDSFELLAGSKTRFYRLEVAV